MTTASRSDRPPSLHIIVATTASTTVVMLPVFLLGGMAILIQGDIPGFDERFVGLIVAVFFSSSAIVWVLGGRLTEAKAPRLGMVVAAVVGGGALVLLAVSSTLVGLATATILAGIANGIAQPASNMGLARGVRVGQQGLAFGIKQSAVPAAGFLAGLTLPVLGLTVGWRYTFALGAVLAVVVILIVPTYFGPPPARRPAGVTADAPGLSLMLLAGAAGCGAAAANSLGAFIVLSSVSYGMEAATAGYLLAAGSIAGIGSRLLMGWLADRRDKSHLLVIASMLAVGSLSYVVMATGGMYPGVIIPVTIVCFGAAWGWPGLLLYAVVQLNPAAPGAATGISAAGAAAGGGVGPLVFGLLAQQVSFPAAWLAAGVIASVSAALTLCAHLVVSQAVAQGHMLDPTVRRRKEPS